MRIAIALIAAVLAAQVRAGATSEPPAGVREILRRSAGLGLGKYPISFWSYTNLKEHGAHMTDAEVDSWADAGFTVPQSPGYDPADPAQTKQMRRILDRAQARGMKLILCDPRAGARWEDRGGKLSVPAGWEAGFRAAAAGLGKHPATLGFHVGDEPDAAMKQAFFECCRLQKQIAPGLHPFANLLPFFEGIEKRAGTDTWAHYLDEFCRTTGADILCYDCYTQMWSGQRGWDSYFENLRLNREAALRNGVPFWTTLLAVGHYAYRCPSYDDLRWQFNTAVASGAHGVSWFFYYMRQPHANYRFAPVDEHWNRTHTYDDLRRIQKSFHRFYGDLFTRIVCTRVMFSPRAFGGGEPFAPGPVVSKLAPDNAPVMLSEFVDGRGRPYVMVVNMDLAESRQVFLTFPGAKVKVYSWNWSGKEAEGGAYCESGTTRDASGLTIQHFLAPGQEAVYRVDLSGEERP